MAPRVAFLVVFSGIASAMLVDVGENSSVGPASRNWRGGMTVSVVKRPPLRSTSSGMLAVAKINHKGFPSKSTLEAAAEVATPFAAGLIIGGLKILAVITPAAIDAICCDGEFTKGTDIGEMGVGVVGDSAVDSMMVMVPKIFREDIDPNSDEVQNILDDIGFGGDNDLDSCLGELGISFNVEENQGRLREQEQIAEAEAGETKRQLREEEQLAEAGENNQKWDFTEDEASAFDKCGSQDTACQVNAFNGEEEKMSMRIVEKELTRLKNPRAKDMWTNAMIKIAEKLSTRVHAKGLMVVADLDPHDDSLAFGTPCKFMVVRKTKPVGDWDQYLIAIGRAALIASGLNPRVFSAERLKERGEHVMIDLF